MAPKKLERRHAAQRATYNLPSQNYTPDELAIRNLFWNMDFLLKSGRVCNPDGTPYSNRKSVFVKQWDARAKDGSSPWCHITNSIKTVGADPFRTMWFLMRWAMESGYKLWPNQVVSYCSKHENNWFLPTEESIRQVQLSLASSLRIMGGEVKFQLSNNVAHDTAVGWALSRDSSNPLASYLFACLAGQSQQVAHLLGKAAEYYVLHQVELEAIPNFEILDEIKEAARELRVVYFS